MQPTDDTNQGGTPTPVEPVTPEPAAPTTPEPEAPMGGGMPAAEPTAPAGEDTAPAM